MKMDENIKELIAIGAAIAANCQPCLAFHVDKAKRLGIGDEEINEAMSMGLKIQNGAMSAMNKFAENMFSGSENKQSSCCDSGVSDCCR